MPDGTQEGVISVLSSAEALQTAAIGRLELAGFDRTQFGGLAPQAAIAGWRRHPTATTADVARNPAAPNRTADQRDLAPAELEAAGVLEVLTQTGS